jgi:hypothetical protein
MAKEKKNLRKKMTKQYKKAAIKEQMNEPQSLIKDNNSQRESQVKPIKSAPKQVERPSSP